MNPDDADGRLRRLAAAVEDAIPDALRREWERRSTTDAVLVARQGIFNAAGETTAYQFSYRTGDEMAPAPSTWSLKQHDEATAHVLSADRKSVV